jgi:flavorubredoxin
VEAGVLGHTELVPGELYRLGEAARLDGTVSWVHPDRRGWLPVNAYLLRRGSAAVLIDTGVAAHRDAVLAGLGDLLDGVESLVLVLSRVVEYDSTGNATSVIRRFGPKRVVAHTPAAPWIDYNDPEPFLEEAAAARPTYEEFGPQVKWGREDELALEVIRTPLRLLLTAWTYDPHTRTLFTSDSFGYSLLNGGADPRITAAGDDLESGRVEEQMLAKFNWLDAADTSPIVRGLDGIFGDREIDRIAPGFGCVIEGADVVRRHRDMVREVVAARASDG